GMGVEARDLHGTVFRGHRGHWGVIMHVDPVSGITVTGTINQSARRPDALALGAVAAVRDHLPVVQRVLLRAPELAAELNDSMADGLSRRPGWSALEKVRGWLQG
ncbi:MAG: hypothetical protein ACK5QW_03085, partial [Cyanobacteriota bacterium]